MKKPRFSVGSIVMLLVTLFVVVGMAAFLMLIAGDGVYERTRAAFGLIAEQIETIPPTPTDVPTVSPAPEVTSAPTASPQPTAEPAGPPRNIIIAAAGTIYAPKSVRESVQEGTDHYDFTPTFEGLSGALAGADLSIVTLETLAAGREKGYGNYNTTPQIFDALRAVGVNFVSLATERALDKGYDGLDITASELTSHSMGYAGAYPDGVNTGATMLRIGGVQVAVLAYSYGLSDEGRKRTRDDSRGVVAMMESQRVVRDITQARVDGANIVVVLPHWGTKNSAQTPDTVQTMAREMAQAGADVILGTHPNVAQGVERLQTVRSDGLTYETVVCYSLGCLLTDARDSENTAGMAVRLEMTYDPATRRASPGELTVTPLYIARQREDSGILYRVVDAENEQALQSLTMTEQAAAAQAAKRVRSATQEE